MTRIEGEVAVVTGGASGIGRAIAGELISRGAVVALADIEADAVQRTAAEIGAHPFVVDVGSDEAVAAFAADVARSLGSVGILVNNAGVASLAPLVAMSDADWRWLLEVNLLGIVRGVRAFLPQVRERGGHILNTGSMAGLAATSGLGGYGASKFAVTAYTEVLAEELAGEGVGVTLLVPGPVRTRLGESSRNRPDGSEGALRDDDLSSDEGQALPWIDAEQAARIAVDAIVEDRRYAVTHPQWRDDLFTRHRRIEAAFAP